MNRITVFLLLLFLHLVRCVVEDTEVILLPMQWNSSNSTVPLSFTVFGKQIDLLLSKNENLLSPNFEVWKRGYNDSLTKVYDSENNHLCHYIYEDSITSAAINLCNTGTVHGFVFLENDSLEITPLSDEKSNVFDQHRIQERSSSYGEPHIVKRRQIPSFQDIDNKNIQLLSRRLDVSTNDVNNKPEEKKATSLTIELAVFFDAAAYDLFRDQLSNDESRILDMMLAYINNVQALYYHPSLGERIRIALVRLELMERQPTELAGLDGERGQVLDAFCSYSKALNPPDDADPKHWDVGLYVSGLDFYARENGSSNPVTMGLAPVGGVCWPEFACVIAEFGVSNRLGKPYPSAGFTSVYVAAHEIAHNLGMHHDSTNNDCPKDGYIMSPSRGVQGESQWSRCSREVAVSLAANKPCLLDGPGTDSGPQRLDHSGRFAELPGRRWTAKHQCQILLRDSEAYAETGPKEEPCQALKCRTPNRMGEYLAGPALDGTKCDEGKACRAGDCLPIEDHWEVPPSSTSPSPDGWSEWRRGKCESGCIRGSLGYLERRRTCLRDTGCPGLSFDVQLCKGRKLCGKRRSVQEYAGQRCLEFAKHLPEIEAGAPGLQAEHEPERPWVACALFCRRKDIASYYAPRIELNDLGLEAYLPDGTWCHRDPSGENYFCRRHHCLPESFRFGKGLPSAVEDEALMLRLLGPMNAVPIGWRPPPELRRYFSLDEQGRPLLTRLETADLPTLPSARDGDPWLDENDFIELPELVLRRQTALLA